MTDDRGQESRKGVLRITVGRWLDPNNDEDTKLSREVVHTRAVSSTAQIYTVTHAMDIAVLSLVLTLILRTPNFHDTRAILLFCNYQVFHENGEDNPWTASLRVISRRHIF
jgi:hypothetical protein